MKQSKIHPNYTYIEYGSGITFFPLLLCITKFKILLVLEIMNLQWYCHQNLN